MPESLASVLRRRQAASLRADAEFIRDWTESAERLAQATILIREAMYRCSVGRLSQAEESAIFTVLEFAMPDGNGDAS